MNGPQVNGPQVNGPQVNGPRVNGPAASAARENLAPTPLTTLAEWAARLDPARIPERVRALAASQLLSQLAAIRAGAAEPLGRRMTEAFGPPLQPDVRTSACVLSGLGSWLNLDDTAYAGHLSNSTVAVPLAYAYARELDGAALLAAVVAANECAARITAAATLGPLRGQSAVHTHLAGAVVGRLHSERAATAVFAHALGLAFAMPPWPLDRAFLASDARLFHSFAPVRTALDACDAAHAGFTGPEDLLEHPDGFLERYATVPLPEAVTAGLGERWHTETLSFKMRPGGPGIDAAVDCAIELHRVLGPLSSRAIEEIVVEASLYTVAAGRKAEHYVRGPGAAPLGALVLHPPYTVATALLTGDLTVDDLAEPRSAEAARWETAGRVRLRHDPGMTRALFASEAPFGEAVRTAGARAEEWLVGFGGPELVRLAAEGGEAGEKGGTRRDFAEASKATGARVTVRLNDGTEVSREREIPLGAAGPHTRAHHADLVREKFVGLGGDRRVAARARDVETMRAPVLRRWIEAALH